MDSEQGHDYIRQHTDYPQRHSLADKQRSSIAVIILVVVHNIHKIWFWKEEGYVRA
jgi:hypothetical protein